MTTAVSYWRNSCIILPILIIGFRNPFNDGKKTSWRFVFSVAAVWGYLLGVRVVVDTLDHWLATTPEQIQAICDGDGAKNAFVSLFGWIPGIVLSFLAWGIIRIWIMGKPYLIKVIKYCSKN